MLDMENAETSSPSVAFPAPTSDDPDEVVIALETASTLWERGDTRDALRWLRRAAETAGEAGEDLRAVQLARAAADLTAELELPASTPLLALAAAAPASSRAAEAQQSPIAPSVSAARARQALRVCVERTEEEKVLKVRVLAEGELVPESADEALLVALEPGVHLLGRRR